MRCKIIDKHMQILSGMHLETRFCRINAESSPFLCEKLKIWMLPTLSLVLDGKIIDYIVGFDDMGGSDDFTTTELASSMRNRAENILFPEKDDYSASQALDRPENTNLRAGNAMSWKTSEDEDSDFE